MMTIDINNQEGVKFLLFNDNQPHAMLQDGLHGISVNVRIAIRSSLDLLHLMLTADALNNSHCVKETLQISYLLGARSDRHMTSGDSFDLRVIAEVINMVKFKEVLIVDPHSDVATALINNSSAVSNKFLVREYVKENAVLIVPDAGATKKSPKYFEWNGNLVDEVVCIKHRNVENGKLTLKVIEPEKCAGRNCVVIDDLCDGGATFIAIAEQIQPQHLTLVVTHGIFSKGTAVIQKQYDQILVGETYFPSVGKHSPGDFIRTFNPWS